MKSPSIFSLRIFILFLLGRVSVNCFAEEKEKVLVTISKETTVITEPLNAAGYPDYVAAIDKKYRDRIKPERNAFITILRMTGPKEFGWRNKRLNYSKHYELVYKKLGIEPLAEKGNYLIDAARYVEELPVKKLPNPNTVEEKIEDEKERIQAIRNRLQLEEFDAASERPWTAREFPHAAKWLAQQEQILKQLEEFDRRDQFYAPYISDHHETLIHSNMGHISMARTVAWILQSRANLHLGNGDIEKSWDDCRRLMMLANYFYQLPTLVEMLVGRAYEGMATTVLMNDIVHDARTTVAQLRNIEKEFQAFGGPDFAKVVDEGERYSLLNAITNCAERGFDNETIGLGKKTDAKLPYVPYWDKKLVQFDTLLKNANAGYDRLVKIAKTPTYTAKIKDLGVFESEIEHDKKIVGEKTWTAVGQHLFAEPEVRTKKVSMIFRYLYFSMLGTGVKIQAKQQMSRELYRSNFALARFYKQHQKYPSDFTELKSFGVSKLPTDIFTDKPCIYQCDGEGFLLYSVSADTEDSGGYNGTTDDAVYHDDVAVFSLNRRPKAPK